MDFDFDAAALGAAMPAEVEAALREAGAQRSDTVRTAAASTVNSLL